MPSFSEDGVETAETAYALALAYTNVQDDDAERMSWRYCTSLLITNKRSKTFGKSGTSGSPPLPPRT